MWKAEYARALALTSCTSACPQPDMINRLLCAFGFAACSITVTKGWQLVLRSVESHRKERVRARLGLC